MSERGTPGPDGDSLERGMRAVFGSDDSATPPSVLRMLQARTGSKLGKHLPDPNGERATPVLKAVSDANVLHSPTSGRYQVVGEIARGGVGVVYKGHDVDLGRDVAVKVLQARHQDNANIVERFVEEAQIGGQLQHPGIVPVYELGLQHDGRPYFAMKLVKGETLAEQLARREDPTRDRRRFLGVFEQVCQTIGYAHARRVVHRDLKPSNVMVGAFGEVQVVDWGFAKVLPRGGVADEERQSKPAQAPKAPARSVIATVRSDPDTGTHSVAGSVMGTPSYMSPEQAQGDVEQMDERSDVFSLGAMLCELLTGEPPYAGAPAEQLIECAKRCDLQLVYDRLDACGADETLVELTERCLSRSRSERPASAQELAERIGEYLSSVEERAREAQIHAAEARVRARSTVLLSAVAVMVLLLGGGGYMWFESEASARRAKVAQQVADAMNDANELLGQARAAGLADSASWDRAAASAEQARVFVESDDADSELRTRVSSLLATVQGEQAIARARRAQDHRDEAMQRRLIEVLIADDEDREERHDSAGFEPERLDREYGEVFREYLDGDLDALTVDAAVAAISRGTIEVELAVALDHWAIQRQKIDQKAGQNIGTRPATAGRTPHAHLRSIARRLDPDDDWRNQLRALIASPSVDRAALEQLATTADWDALPAISAIVLGQALWAAGAKHRAAEVYQQAQDRYPAHFALAFRLATALDRLEEWRQAEEFFRVARSLRPSWKFVESRFAWVKLRQRDHAGALAVFERLVGEHPEYPRGWNGLGSALKAQGDLDGAIASHKRAIELAPTVAGYHYNLGNAFQVQGELDEAIASYRRATELDPDFADAHDNLGLALRAHGELEQAIASHERAVAINPNRAGSHDKLGGALRAHGELEAAIASYERAIELDRTDAKFHANLGHALRAQGELDQAITCYGRAVGLDQDSHGAHCRLGQALMERGESERAIATLRLALELDSQCAISHVNLGLALQQQGDLVAAIASYERAIEIDAAHAPAHYRRGIALRSRGDIEAALASFRTAHDVWQRESGDDAETWREKAATNIRQTESFLLCQTGDELEERGERDAAIETYRRAVELLPENAYTHYLLAAALRRQGSTDEAIANGRRSVELDARPSSHTLLGLALKNCGDAEGAIASFHRALELSPDYAAAHFHLGSMAERSGELASALASYRRAAEITAPGQTPYDAALHAHAADRVARMEWAVDHADEFLAVLNGKREARSKVHWAWAAESMYVRRDFARAADSFARAFAEHPDLLMHGRCRYIAARAAARAGCGDGVGGAERDAIGRARLRDLAHGWLRAQLAFHEQALAGDADRAPQVLERLSRWQRNYDFHGVRGDRALLALPDAEAARWRALWADVARVRAQIEKDG